MLTNISLHHGLVNLFLIFKSNILPSFFIFSNTFNHSSKSEKLSNNIVALVKSVRASNHSHSFKSSLRTFSIILSFFLGHHINNAFADASLARSKNICL
jgi:hypothetical protein